MNIEIEPLAFTDAEYEAIVELHNTAFPNKPSSVDEWKADNENRDPKYFYRRLKASVDGKIVGTGSYEEPSWAFIEGKYFIRVVVHPAHRRQGIGTKLYTYIEEALASRKPTLLTASTHQDQTEGIRFLEKHGFVQNIYEPMSRLDVERFDLARFSDMFERIEATGIKIFSGTELLAQDSNFWQKIYDFDAVATQDLPLPTPYTMPEFETFVKEMSDERRGFDPDFWMVAVAPSQDEDGVGDYVGRSTLWQDMTNPHKVYNGLTGVLRDYRRRGLATALKARVIESARQNGVSVAETQNEEHNPMLQLNLALGFEIVNAYLGYEKRLSHS